MNAIWEHESNPNIKFTAAKSRRQRFASLVRSADRLPMVLAAISVPSLPAQSFPGVKASSPKHESSSLPPWMILRGFC